MLPIHKISEKKFLDIAKIDKKYVDFYLSRFIFAQMLYVLIAMQENILSF